MIARVEAERGRRPDAHLTLELAQLRYLAGEFETARRLAQEAFGAFRAEGLAREAALAAAFTGRVYLEGLDNQPAANGWFGRALSMLEGEGPCPERGWVLLGIVGCSEPDADALEAKAAEALAIARRVGDAELECKALADGGLAGVSKGDIGGGLRRIDEAMAMVANGEIGFFVAGQVLCDTVTACERSGQISRLEGWLDALHRAGVAGPEGPAPFLFAHCHASYGSLLCRLGRWTEAETALTVAAAAGRGSFGSIRGATLASLAELRVRQGRIDEAAVLLDSCPVRVDTALARTLLFIAQGRFDHAANVASWGIAQLGEGDLVQAVPLLELRVRAELGRGQDEAAEAAVEDMEERLRQAPTALGAFVALARARLALHRDRRAEALQQLRRGLSALEGGALPLLSAELHLLLAELQADEAPEIAELEARAALDLYGRIAAPEMRRCSEVLARLGVPVKLPSLRVSPIDSLSPREKEVLTLVGRGLSNPEIAAELFIARKTAEHHVCNLLRKLGLRNRAEAAAYLAAAFPAQAVEPQV